MFGAFFILAGAAASVVIFFVGVAFAVTSCAFCACAKAPALDGRPSYYADESPSEVVVVLPTAAAAADGNDDCV